MSIVDEPLTHARRSAVADWRRDANQLLRAAGAMPPGWHARCLVHDADGLVLRVGSLSRPGLTFRAEFGGAFRLDASREQSPDASHRAAPMLEALRAFQPAAGPPADLTAPVAPDPERLLDAARQRLTGVLPAGVEVTSLRWQNSMAVLSLQGGGVDQQLEWFADDGSRPCFLRHDGIAVGYRGTPSGVVAAGLRAIAERLTKVEPGLLRAGARRIVERRAFVFCAPELAAWLFEDADAPLLQMPREVSPHSGGEVALVFDGGEGRAVRRLRLRPTDPARQTARRTALLDISYTLALAEHTPEAYAKGLDDLAAVVARHIEAREPGVTLELAPRARTTPRRASGRRRALNLALPSDCGQRCTFCSVREEVPLLDSPELLRRLRSDLAEARANGASVLRINGIEPLRSPHLFALLEAAHELGYADFHVYTTARPLADRDFAERLAKALGPRYRISIPLYGLPPTHDAMVGVPEAFGQVVAAFENALATLGSQAELTANTVLCRQNAAELAGVAEIVHRFTRRWDVHLPFPSQSGIQDPYRMTALRHRDALEAVYPSGAPAIAALALGEVPICVALAHARDSNHDLFDAEHLRRLEGELSGTRYLAEGEFAHTFGGSGVEVFNAATTPCPHVERCALSAICPAKIYALYEELYGLDELEAVSPELLEEMPTLANYARPELSEKSQCGPRDPR